MIDIRLSNNAYFGDTGPQPGDKGKLYTYLSTDPDDHHEHFYAAFFPGHLGYFVLNNRQFVILI